MKERPIIFNGNMVRAILDGRKTQERRPVKPQPNYVNRLGIPFRPDGPVDYRLCPHGAPGDRLWVREKFGSSRQDDDVNNAERVIVYAAGEPFHITDSGVDGLKRGKSGHLMQPNHHVPKPHRWKPSIHMPRWASRITLEVTAVRVERVQDITKEDAMAEGIERVGGDYSCSPWRNYSLKSMTPSVRQSSCPRHSFMTLWKSIYCTWDANPWVWVVEFRRIP